MNSSPTATASTGLCRLTFGRPGMAPSTTSSMLGRLAFVMETESPSQLSPAVIQRMSTSFTAGGRCACRSLPIARAMPCLLCASVNASPLVRSTRGSETRPLYDGEAREVRNQAGTRALTDARQLFAGEHCQHALAAHHGADGDVACVIVDDAADDRRLAPQRVRAQRSKRAVCLLRRDRGHQPALAGDVERIEAQHLAGAAHFRLERHRAFVDLHADARRLAHLVQGAREPAARGVAHAAHAWGG